VRIIDSRSIRISQSIPLVLSNFKKNLEKLDFGKLKTGADGAFYTEHVAAFRGNKNPRFFCKSTKNLSV
jgi:hypothetical protein